MLHLHPCIHNVGICISSTWTNACGQMFVWLARLSHLSAQGAEGKYLVISWDSLTIQTLGQWYGHYDIPESPQRNAWMLVNIIVTMARGWPVASGLSVLYILNWRLLSL